MIFNENRLLAGDSHEISYLMFFEKLGIKSQTLSSAAVVFFVLLNVQSQQLCLWPDSQFI